MLRKLGNILTAVRRHGLPVYLARLARRAWQSLVFKRHESTVFCRELAGAVELLEAKIPVEVVPFTAERRAELYAFLGRYERPEQIDDHFRAGWMPMLGYHQGRVIAVSWCSLRPIYLDTVELTLDYGARSGYIERTRTDDAMKGQGVAPAIRTRICQYLRDAGCNRVFVSAGDDNVASQTVARKAGFVPYESILLTRVLGFRRHERKRIAAR